MVMKSFILKLALLLSVASPALAQFGFSTTTDLVFTPITPCRIVDTRVVGAGGVIATATSRVFKGWAATYTTQGGSATNCNLPQSTDVAALSVNLLVVAPTGEGWIAAWPVGTTMPLVSNLNYKANDVLANSAILKINQTTADFNLYTTTATHFVADVTGYYSRPKGANLSCTNPPETTLVVAAGTVGRLAIPACPATNSYSSIGGYCTTDGTDMATYGGSSSGECAMKNMGASSATITAGRRCCGVPGHP
jgi:hypothetical protein